MEYRLSDRQRWLDRRLKDLEPSHFFEGTAFCVPPELKLPQRFRRHWSCLRDLTYNGSIQEAGGPPKDLSEPEIILIFGSPDCESDLNFLCDLVDSVDVQGTAAPPLFWAPHTVEPTLRSEHSAAPLHDKHFVTSMIQLGLDGIVAGEPEGVGLAVSARGRIAKSAATSASLDDVVNLRRSRSERLQHLKCCIHYTLWGYLRQRVVPCLPPVDNSMSDGLVPVLDGYRVGERLGGGTCGTVYSLSPIPDAPEHLEKPRRRAPPGGAEVVKVVSKEGTKDLGELRGLKRMIEVMELLSSDEWKHPNIVRTYGTYHSPTHLFFRMESGGDSNLFRRLARRDVEGPKKHPLNLGKACMLISQALEAISYLHTGPRVCHRDIKPENMVVDETSDTLTLKLCDFDLALVTDKAALKSYKTCGTFPFLAPELMLGQGYYIFVADIWSLGVVLLEILCGNSFLDRYLDFAEVLKTHGVPKNENLRRYEVLGQVIRKAFLEPRGHHEMLEAGLYEELEALLPWAQDALRHILEVVPESRCSAEELHVYSQTVQAFGCGAHAASEKKGSP